MDFYLTLDSLRLNRTDNALIRINTELREGEKPEDAERRLLGFAGEINPLLKNYIPLLTVSRRRGFAKILLDLRMWGAPSARYEFLACPRQA